MRASGAVIATRSDLTSIAGAAALLLLMAGPSAQAAPGEPDPSFGIGGQETWQLAPSKISPLSEFHAITITPVGKIVLAGSVGWNAGSFRDLLAEANEDGSLETSFGSGGSVITTSEEQGYTLLSDYASTELIRSDGTIVLGGNPGVAEVTSSGIPVPGYLGQEDGYTEALAELPDGNMLAAGSEHLDARQPQPAVLRELLPDGELDRSFGTDGVLNLPLPEGQDAEERADSMILLPDEKVLLAGAGHYWTGAQGSEAEVSFLWVTRLEDNGAPDRTFGSEGVEYVDGHGEVDGAPSVVPVLLKQTSGRLVLVGSGPPLDPTPETFEQMRAWALTPDGQPEPSFGNDGSTLIPVLGGPGASAVTAAALDAQGRILITGTQYPNAEGAGVAVLTRLTASGELDTSYGNDGFAVGPEHSLFSAVTVDPEGRAVVAGQHRLSAAIPGEEYDDAFVERFLGAEGGESVPDTLETVAGASTSHGLAAGVSGAAETRVLHCIVPALDGKTLARARRMLSAAHCSLGHIKRARGRHAGQVIVRSQSPEHGERLGRGADVNLRMGVKRRTAARSGVASGHPATLHLTATVYDVHTIKGVYSSKERVYEGTTKVGEDSSSCTKETSSTVHCTGSYKLKHGTILFSGTISDTSDTNRLTITGGTGSYRNARGTVFTEYNRLGTKATETITFT